MISQTKRSDLPRPAIRAPLRKYLPPPTHVSALRAQKRERILSDGSLLLCLLCGTAWLLCFSLARPFVHATTITHHNVSWCLMFRLPCCLLSGRCSLCLLLLPPLPVCLLPLLLPCPCCCDCVLSVVPVSACCPCSTPILPAIACPSAALTAFCMPCSFPPVNMFMSSFFCPLCVFYAPS